MQRILGDGMAGLKTTYKRHSLVEVESYCYTIYEKVKEFMTPDIIIAIARGGWIPARLLCDHFAHVGEARYDEVTKKSKIPIQYPHIFNVGVKRYGTLEAGRTEWYQPLTEEIKAELRGKKVLIVDDVLDAGVTLAEVTRQVKDAKPDKLAVAVIDFKKDPYNATPEEKSTNEKERGMAMLYIQEATQENFYYSNELENNVWIIYPWEAREGSLEVYKRFGEKDFSETLPIKSELKERLVDTLTKEFDKIDEEKKKIGGEE